MTHDSPQTGLKGTRTSMNTQLHLARGIVEGRIHTDQDLAVQRTVELALAQERRTRRGRRFLAR